MIEKIRIEIRKQNIALKLHCQFSHPNAQKLVSLLKDANVDDKELQ